MATLPVMPTGWRVPFFYAQVDGSKAGSTTYDEKTLIVANRTTAAGTAVNDTLYQVFSADDAAGLFGTGSVAHAMVHAYRRNDPFGELWVLPVADPATGPVANTWTITVGGPATENGTVHLYIGDYDVQTTVTNGDAANTIATNMDAAITAALNDHPITVTSGVVAPAITLTARSAGLHGNDLIVQTNYRGAAAGEVLPAGVTVGIVNNAIGAGTFGATMATSLAALGDEPFDFILHPWSATADLNSFQTLLEDTTGRWAAGREIYGHAFTSIVGTVGAMTAIGAARNDPHHTIFAYYLAPTPPWEWTGAHVGQIAQSVKKLPSQPLQTLIPIGCLPPPRGAGRFTNAQKQTLLSNGLSVSSIVGNTLTVAIDRVISTYQTNAGGSADDAYLDVTTPYTLMRLMRRLKTVITTDFSRHVLMNDGSRFAAGLPVATPRMIRARIISEYQSCIFDALTENLDAFTEYLTVERSLTDPNRVEVLYPPDLANQLRIFDVLAQFRLQYATAAL